MDDEPDDLLSISIDTDDYAQAAATDTPAIPRTHQTEPAFRSIQSTYRPRIDGAKGTSYRLLLAAVPVLADTPSHSPRALPAVVGSRSTATVGITTSSSSATTTVSDPVPLTRKDRQMLAAAAGEMYFDGELEALQSLCRRVRERCVVGPEVKESLGRWCGRIEGGGEKVGVKREV